MSEETRPFVIRLAPDLRRSAIYVMIAMPVTAALYVGVNHFVEEDVRFPGLIMLGLIGVAMIVPLRWALRVEVQGIARRRLFGWDLWEWSTFANGRIAKERGLVLVDPDRPWWRRRLAVGLTGPSGRQRLIELINRHYRLPPPPIVAGPVKISHGLTRTLVLDDGGIEVGVRRFRKEPQRRRHAWDAVQRVHVTREDPVRRDFVRLEIVLPDEEEIVLRAANPWRGASAEELNEMLYRHAPAERIEIDMEGEPPARRSDLEKTLGKAVNDYRTIRRGIPVFFLILVGFLVIQYAVTENLLGIAFLTLFFGLMSGLWWFVFKEMRGRIDALRKDLEAYD